MASLKSFTKSLEKKLLKEIAKGLDKCLPSEEKKRTTTNTSYMCWLTENRGRFEICSDCDLKMVIDEHGKKKCPKCNARISSKNVMILAGEHWRAMSTEEKERYVMKAKNH